MLSFIFYRVRYEGNMEGKFTQGFIFRYRLFEIK